jgi:hypothetical protein
MTHEELLSVTHAACPELIEKTAQIISALEQEDEDAAASVVSDVRDILDYTLEKTAASRADWAGLGLAVGGSIIGSLALATAGDIYNAAKRGLSREVNFRRMMKANPDLKHENRQDLRDSFSLIHRYGPEFTADPTLAAHLVRTAISIPGSALDLASKMTQMGSSLQSARTRFTPSSFSLEDSRRTPSTDPLEVAKYRAGVEHAQNVLKTRGGIATKAFEHALREGDTYTKAIQKAQAASRAAKPILNE